MNDAIALFGYVAAFGAGFMVACSLALALVLDDFCIPWPQVKRAILRKLGR